MNLQFAGKGSSFFPFGSSGLNTEKIFESSKNNIPKQERQLLEDKSVELKQRENCGLSREAVTIIGDNGRRRFEEFRKYPNGWYGGKGKKLSSWSVSSFEVFIKRIPELKKFHPSLFLTLEGNLQLGWEDGHGQTIEIEFHPDKTEYFIENSNEESSVALVDTFRLTEKITKLLEI